MAFPTAGHEVPPMVHENINDGGMTEGEHRVGVSFNPSGLPEVDRVKQAAAALVDAMVALAADRSHPGARCAALAATGFEEAAMWAVKALTKKPRE